MCINVLAWWFFKAGNMLNCFLCLLRIQECFIVNMFDVIWSYFWQSCRSGRLVYREKCYSFVYCLHSRQRPWLNVLAVRGKMMTLSVVDQLPAFLQDLRGSFECTAGKRHGDVQIVMYLLAVFFRGDSPLTFENPSRVVQSASLRWFLFVSTIDYPEVATCSIDWCGEALISLSIPWYTQSLTAFPLQLWVLQLPLWDIIKSGR